MPAGPRILIVGASAAGLSCAEELRRRGHGGEVILLGEEPHLPYDRPPLSKQVLTGAWDAERTALRRDYDDLGLEWRLGERATGLDLDRRVVTTAGGDEVAWERLVIATGAAPISLPEAAGVAGVHLLRTLDDALALRADLGEGARLLVIGAGYLGTEVAASARGLGAEVTIVDRLPTPLARPLGHRIGSRITALHEEHGVELKLGVGVDLLRAEGGRVTAVELTDGSVREADAVLIAIGARPSVGWLEGSGLELDDGVVCDAYCRATTDVYAAGDVASWPNPCFGGERMRLEHRMNATEQGMLVGRNLLGAEEEFAPVPYFWSDQYDTKLQAYGIFPCEAETVEAHGKGSDPSFTLVWVRDGIVCGAVGWNAPRELRSLRQAIAERAQWQAPQPV